MIYANTKNAQPKQTHKPYLNLNQHAKLRTVHACVCIITYNCHTQYNAEQI